jgi:protein associated with RNAse G/E
MITSKEIKDGKASRIEYYNDLGHLHNVNDEPAIVYANGSKVWCKDNVYHRDGDKPAVVYYDGREYYYVCGVLHRDTDEPAMILPDGEFHYFKMGRLHRDGDKPASIYPTRFNVGKRLYFRNGLLHRDNNMPAVEYDDGRFAIFRNGKKICQIRKSEGEEYELPELLYSR